MSSGSPAAVRQKGGLYADIKRIKRNGNCNKKRGKGSDCETITGVGGHACCKEKIDSETEISVYKNGFVHYRAGKNNTVFGIWNCDESYCYKSTKDFSTIIDSSYFDDAEWYIRLIIEGEDILERNQKRVRSNHKEFLFDDLGTKTSHTLNGFRTLKIQYFS